MDYLFAPDDPEAVVERLANAATRIVSLRKEGMGATEIAKILFFIFVVLFVISLVAGLVRRGP